MNFIFMGQGGQKLVKKLLNTYVTKTGIKRDL